jgi:hypothetical protein
MLEQEKIITRHAANRLRQRINVSEQERDFYRVVTSEIAYYLPRNKNAIVVLSKEPRGSNYNIAIIKNKLVITFYKTSRQKILRYIERDFLFFEARDAVFKL